MCKSSVNKCKNCEISMNVLWIRNCKQYCYWAASGHFCIYSSEQAVDAAACALSRWQH